MIDDEEEFEVDDATGAFRVLLVIVGGALLFGVIVVGLLCWGVAAAATAVHGG